MSIKVRGAEAIKNKLDKLSKPAGYGSALNKALLVIERALRKEVPRDRGIMVNSITSSVTGMLKGIVRINATHGVYQNYGYTIRKGRVFFDRKSGTFRRVKATRFIPGKHFVEKTIEDTKKEVADEIRKAVIDA